MQTEGGHGQAFGRLTEGNAAGDVDVTHQDWQQEQTASVVHTVGVVRQRLSRQSEGARTLSPEASGCDNFVGRYTSDFLSLFRSELVNVLGVFFETVCPLIDEGLIIRFSLIRTRAIPAAKAASVPMAGARWISAISAAFVLLVSTVMILQPRAFAALMASHQPKG